MKNKEKYFAEINEKINRAYEYGNKARQEGKDLDIEVESVPARNLALRVEGLVGPKGIASRIKILGRENIAQIIDEILGDFSSLPREELESRVEQAIRTSLAILTEGVVAAPIEGISEVKISENPDGSLYLSLYFAGPIRSAGGTAQGVTVVIGDYLRRKIGLKEYRPTSEEMERYVEEIKIYHNRVSRLQYMPSDNEIREILRNLPVCIDGDPTEKREVSIHRDLKRIKTNRIRGGMCLVMGEGIAQKATKLVKYAHNLNLDWGWLAEIKKEDGEKEEEGNGQAKFMSEIVGGRPIFSSASKKGGFRVRYGRSRCSGLAGKAIHPALQVLLGGFIATGTQLKVEKPGKGCIITACDSIEGPVVKLKDESVIRVESVEKALEIKSKVQEILFLGDILISYGDFLQSNAPLMPTGYCEEFWLQELKEKTDQLPSGLPTPQEALELAKQFDLALHPYYTYHWEDLKVSGLEKLGKWLLKEGELGDGKFLVKNTDSGAKRILELLGVPHEVKGGEVIIKEYLPLLVPLGIYEEGEIKKGNFLEKVENSPPQENGHQFITKTSPIKIRKKVGAYIGARMGRPEKAKERKMSPPVHSLFPVGRVGGKERLINVAVQKGTISVEAAKYECPECKLKIIFPTCPQCGKPAVLKKVCSRCNLVVDRDICPQCKNRTRFYEKQSIDIKSLWKKAVEKVGLFKVKGVQGMISSYKIPEPLEKGLLRAKNNVFVFKDGSIRYDMTDAPLTHFKPKEIGTKIEKLRELGYLEDIAGKELTDETQILELKAQDIVIPEDGLAYIFRVSKFVDEELEKFYALPKFYNARNKEDLVGELVIGLAPHTSAGITARIIGTTRANVCFAHPFWHAAKRRNADGDEDSIILFLDVLLNFSKKYLPEKRGGQMDAPLVISTILDPKEIDDEAHKMEITSAYPLSFYYDTLKKKNPSEVKLKIVKDVLDSDPYPNLKFTHSTGDITGAVIKSNYVTLKTMEDKVNAQLKVAEKVRAVDEKEVAELVINSHFLRDTYGNLRAFSQQKFRCVKCNKIYRRIPLVGKCTACGGRLLLTVPEGGVRKYIGLSLRLSEKYNVSPYLKQRLMLIRRDVDSIFVNDLSQQVGLGDFM